MNTLRTNLFISLVFTFSLVFSQDSSKVQELDSVVITSTRIDLPFSQNSRTIEIITASQIAKSPATNLADLLQQEAGIDIRRRGVEGMQADLYIRGGGFDQTLLLIDGIKVEDPQTGHHTMNLALPLEVIERVEIIKGAAARVFGQNAFTGAINIVTKKEASNVNAIAFQLGSYDQQNFIGTVGKDFGNTSVIAHTSFRNSDGYRFNTDFENQNYFLKSTFNKRKTPINFIGYFSERKFGANGFYASPAAVNQYEETQGSLIGLTSTYVNKNLTLKPRIYWRRNQDMYVFVRNNPSIYRNLHISNKVGAEINASYKSDIGITGFGVDLAKVYLSSNNLGDRDRFMMNIFAEHRFKLANDKLDITPGIAVNYFSDFKFHAFPGVDVGYQISNSLKAYANAGYTYRVPTYTDLFYSDPTTLGNENLDPEEAFTAEAGIKYNANGFSTTLVVFNRNSDNIIDYVKENEDDLWQATNIQSLNSFGVEASANYGFDWFDFNQNLNLSYAYLNEDLDALEVNFSRYSINSLKHQFITTFDSQFLNNLRQSIVYRFAERTSGDSYSVVDIKASLLLKSFTVSIIANNIFNEEYSETNMVPMPKGNVLAEVKYSF